MKLPETITLLRGSIHSGIFISYSNEYKSIMELNDIDCYSYISFNTSGGKLLGCKKLFDIILIPDLGYFIEHTVNSQINHKETVYVNHKTLLALNENLVEGINIFEHITINVKQLPLAEKQPCEPFTCIYDAFTPGEPYYILPKFQVIKQ